MAEHVINISATTANPTPLVINDDENHSANTDEGDRNLTTDVKIGDTIRWRHGGNIIEIVTIIGDPHKDICDPDPARQDDGSWLGTVKQNAPLDDAEYGIKYTVAGHFEEDGKTLKPFIQDPKIRVHV